MSYTKDQIATLAEVCDQEIYWSGKCCYYRTSHKSDPEFDPSDPRWAGKYAVHLLELGIRPALDTNKVYFDIDGTEIATEGESITEALARAVLAVKEAEG